jgi:hypothetical protein
MSNEDNQVEPIPESFGTIDEAAEFWDRQDLSDYWDQTQDVEIEVRAPRRQWVPLAAELAGQLTEQARQEGVSIETLVNLWVAERLRTRS